MEAQTLMRRRLVMFKDSASHEMVVTIIWTATTMLILSRSSLLWIFIAKKLFALTDWPLEVSKTAWKQVLTRRPSLLIALPPNMCQNCLENHCVPTSNHWMSYNQRGHRSRLMGIWFGGRSGGSDWVSIREKVQREYQLTPPQIHADRCQTTWYPVRWT